MTPLKKDGIPPTKLETSPTDKVGIPTKLETSPTDKVEAPDKMKTLTNKLDMSTTKLNI